MLGINDGTVVLAYVLCFVSSGVCVIYAWINWNRGDEDAAEEEKRWRAEEEHVEENI